MSSSVFSQEETQGPFGDDFWESANVFMSIYSEAVEDIEKTAAYSSVTKEELVKMRQKINMTNDIYTDLTTNTEQAISRLRKDTNLENAIASLIEIQTKFSKLDNLQKKVFKYEGWESSKLETMLAILREHRS
jgi:hypothetical protein